jgi:geranylgeranyl pyrophosphate synthase
MSEEAADDVIAALGFEQEIDHLRKAIAAWIDQSSEEVREALKWQFQGRSKYFRPLTVFSCYRAIYEGPIPPSLMRSTLVVEMFHNVSLIIDDILDRSRYRRGKQTLHCRFGNLLALMLAGYITADGYRLIQDDPHDIRLFSELLKRLGVAECMQWRLRRQPLGVEDWRKIAGEDTGSMFEVCACLGTRTEELRHFGHLLGVLYHGCDDVGDMRGAKALGGGGNEDLRDGILTLPAALAIRDPDIAAMFCNPTEQHREKMAQGFHAKLPDAERYLDQLADEAKEQARLFSPNPEPLFALVDHTRQLTHR